MTIQCPKLRNPLILIIIVGCYQLSSS